MGLFLARFLLKLKIRKRPLKDYHGGVEDIEQRKVRFVGNAADRIQEDYLRIMRYFRFYSRLSRNGADHDLGTLRAIEEHGEGKGFLLRFKIFSFLKKSFY